MRRGEEEANKSPTAVVKQFHRVSLSSLTLGELAIAGRRDPHGCGCTRHQSFQMA